MKQIALVLLFICLGSVAHAQDETQTEVPGYTVGFLTLDDDPRYDEDYAYARIQLRPTGNAAVGARMAVQDMKIVTDAVDINVTLEEASGPDDAGLLSAARDLIGQGARYIVTDLAAEHVDALATALEGEDVTLVNTTAQDNWLRNACHANVLHSAASDRMIADAMVQYLRLRDWTRILVLVGKSPRDAAVAEAFQQSAGRLRLEIVDTRDFDLSTNPELRDQNNVQLLTGGVDYDVIYIADTDGEFGRYVPYQSNLPRPVVGTTGLTAQEWHWSLERYGAPQVNSRFEDMSEGGRRMNWQDWSSWVATRAVITAIAKTRDRTPENVDAYLRAERFNVDGSKGVAQSFRSWNGQMRMPILLATHNAIINIAPLEGYLHENNVLDTLGADEPEFQCE